MESLAERVWTRICSVLCTRQPNHSGERPIPRTMFRNGAHWFAVFVAVTPPRGAKTIQEALPEGFEERVKGRGIVWGEWVQQPLILAHPSVGCFVSHCGFGSMWESLMSDCQIVLIPYLADQVLNTRLLTDELEVAVEVQREKTGWFSKENLSVAVNSVMNKDSEIGRQVKKNHSKLKELVVSPGLLTGYTDKFVETLENLLKDTKLASTLT
ncbi:hypothetical protein Bca52824_004265 [Brassica carinata]|uniref:UDP-glycosyltransferases domain-containing protein n=1 Tax=Brassica carinata TaxID=52824 RepID=A0A8X8BFI5_BRACI|nr:hypothetical protein Bca52824_004265 [Brassica carinata]